MSKPRTLIINSYGGSLLVAAQEEGHPIIASLEDKNYGMPSQQLNYPNETYYPFEEEWPLDIELRDAIVIAHPPCSGFSINNRSTKTGGVGEAGRGIMTAAFQCTTKILDYILPRRPICVAIESVIPAMEGAREVHEFFADLHGYKLYRILQTGVSFGCPQWRKRFWILFVRNDQPKTFHIRLRHDIRTVSEVLDPIEYSMELLPIHGKQWKDQVARFERLGLKPKDWFKILKEPKGLLHTLPAKYGHSQKGEARDKFLKKHCVGASYTACALNVLDPNGLAPVLLSSSWWYYNGAMVGSNGYKAIMGFPTEYKFQKEKMTLELLSRGVCPPVARWILQQIRQNLFDEAPALLNYHVDEVMKPGDVVDTRLPNTAKDNLLKFREGLCSSS